MKGLVSTEPLDVRERQTDDVCLGYIPIEGYLRSR